MIIREATIEDAFAICNISCADLGYDCSCEFVSTRISNLDKGREKVFVAEVNEVVAGYIHAEKYQTLYFEPMINILGLAVSSEFRRRGIGRMLLKRAERWANEVGIHKIRLNSGASRKETHSFYRAMGYNNEKGQIRFIKDIE
ncbi:MAG: N-acetyltransferase family protein [Oscillospiraceae bacterium]